MDAIREDGVNHPLSTTLSRRSVLSIGPAMVATGALAETSGDAPQRNLKRFIRMRGALDGRLVIGFISGQYNGVVDGEMTPLFGLYAATFSRYRSSGDAYEIVSFEQAYFTDLTSGQVLAKWKNPYTGEMVAPPVTNPPPGKVFVGSDLRLHSGQSQPQNVKLDMGASGPEILGDEVFFVERLYASHAAEGATLPFSYNENTTLRAKLADVDRSDLKTVPCQTSFDAVVSWRPWLKMESRPGCMTAFGHGKYGAAMADLPKPWLDATAHLRPEILDHPETVLEPLWRA